MKKRFCVLLALLLSLGVFPVGSEASATEPTADPLINNGDFTVLNAEGTFFDDFKQNQGTCAVETETYYSAPYALKLGTAEDDGVEDRVTTQIYNVQAGAKYKFTARVMSGAALAYMSVSCYDENKNILDGFQGIFVSETGGEWEETAYIFTAPKACVRFYMYLRAQGAGVAYFDDVTLEMIESAPCIYLEMDSFLYTEQTNCPVSVTPNTDVYTFAKTDSVSISVFEGETKTGSMDALSISEAADCSLPMAVFPKEGTAYTVKVFLNGTEAASQTMYKYKRPSSLDAEGNAYVNDAPFTPMLGYHVYRKAMLEDAKATGVNLVQSAGATGEELWNYLEIAREVGVMVLASLYGKNAEDPAGELRPAGHPMNEARSREVVSKICKHPNLFGFLVMDEPFTQGTDSFDDTVAYLRDSYKLIREEEMKAGAEPHPVLIQESHSGSYYESSKYCDVLIMHTYPIYPENIKGTFLAYEQTKEAVEVSEGTAIRRRPVYFLGQTFGRNTAEEEGTKYIVPDIDEVREMLTYAAKAGAKGLGYFSFHDNQNGYLSRRPLYADLVEFAKEGLPEIMFTYIGKGKPYIQKKDGKVAEVFLPGESYTAVFPRPSGVNKQAMCIVAQYASEGEKKELLDIALCPFPAAGDGTVTFTIAKANKTADIRALVLDLAAAKPLSGVCKVTIE